LGDHQWRPGQGPDLAEDIDGFEDTDGCPDSDNDGDGVADVYDDCPNMAEDFDGFEDDDGCPDLDNDGDGILDSDDECPGAAETFNNFRDTDGCPDERPIEFPLAYINFKFGTAEISGADPIPVLEEVIRIMRENPEIRVKVTGHTDSIGSDEYNMNLSNRRADAVKQYLVDEGGIDPARLDTEGRGESEPIDTNDTEVGRARNRRIQFSVVDS
jgi:outer membrane protein OmpA-like peptidoglycan-associated protein